MLHPGTRVGGYRIDGVLGAGGMGAVYRATQLSLKREVALKILAGELAQDESFRERFRREGEIQASIDHPNIVTIYEAGDLADNLFIAMRLIRGPALKALILGRDLDPARTLRILQPIADALDTAHQYELIHRDVKPQNILVDARDRAFLADFGLTKGAHDSGLTRTGQFVGTIDYISPEQIRGEPATPASDVYALAAVLFECLTGAVPFARPSDAAILFAHITDPPPRLSEQQPELPPELDEVLARGMAKFPADRHATASELIDEAERAFGGKLRIAPAPPITKPDDVGAPLRQGDVATAGVGIPPMPTQTPHDGPGGRRSAVAPTAPASAPGTADTQAPAPRGRSPEAPASPARRPLPAAPFAAPARPAEPQRDTPAAQPTADVTADRSPEALRLRPRRPPEGEPSPSVRRRAVAQTAAVGPAAGRATATLATLRARAAGSVAAVTGVIVLAAVAGLFLGRSGSADDAARSASTSAIALAGSASSQAIELGVPAGWRRNESPSTLPGVRLRDSVRLTAPELSGAGISAGLADAADRTLLSAGLQRALARPAGDGEPVRLGKLQAYRYRELALEDSSRRLRLYVAPTSAGVANIACFAEPADLARLRSTCDRVAQSVRLVRAKARPLGPDPRYAARVDRVTSRLRSVRGPARRRLARARTPGAQARELRGLAGIHGAAARALRSAAAGPAEKTAHGDLVAAFGAARAAYAQMASAAGAGRRAAYTRGAAAVRRSDGAARAALSELRRLGYRVR